MEAVWKKYHTEIIITALMIVVGSSMHFVCYLVQNEKVMNVLGIIFPVSETSWEHMKMLWYPFLVAGIILSIIRKDWGYFGGFVIGGTLSIPMMIGIFTIYQSFTMHSVLIIDIITFMMVMIMFALLAFDLAKLEIVKKAKIYLIVLAVVVTAVLILLTYLPGEGYVFLDDEGFEGGHSH